MLRLGTPVLAGRSLLRCARRTCRRAGAAGGNARSHAGRPDCRPAGSQGEGASPAHPQPRRGAGEEDRGAVHPGQSPLAPVLRERLCRRRFHGGGGLREVRQPLQHSGSPRQHHVQWLQAHRSGVPRSARVQSPRCAVRAGRVARGHRCRVLRHRHREYLRRRPRELQLPAALSVGRRRAEAHAPPADGGRRSRVLAVGTAVRTGLGALGGGDLHARDLAGPGRQANLSAAARDRGPGLAPCRRLRAARGLLRRHDAGATRTRTARTASVRSTTRPFSTCPS